MPLLLSGAPGSGKSSTALAILSRYAEENGEGEKRFLYVTQSSLLASTLSKEWEKRTTSSNVKVDFKTPLQLFVEHGGNPDSLVGEDFFKSWYERYCKKNPLILKETAPVHGKGKQKAAKQEESIQPPDSADAYQEMRTLSGYPNFKSYHEDVGSKRSLIKDEAVQHWRCEVFQDALPRRGAP